MNNRILNDYIRDVRKQLRNLKPSERDIVIGEIRAHLETEIKRLKKEERLSDDEAALQATTDFGDADEIAVAYGPDGGVIQRSTGELLLEVAHLTGRGIGSVGRGAGTLLKWGAISALILVLIVAAVAVTVAVTYKDEISSGIKESIEHDVYEYHQAWPLTDPETSTHTDSFQINDNVKRFHVDIQVTQDQGCAGVELIRPSGNVIDINGNGCGDHFMESTYTEPGTWQIRYTYAAYVGRVSVDVTAFEKADA